ncbi:MAG: cobalamin-dependent protein [Desulfamplus sp.]|nr:cobalamin-dependent protein [Desulfamplus sp.]
MATTVFNSFIANLLEGNCDESIAEAKKLQESGVSVEEIVIDGIEAAMTLLDAKCTVEQFNLLEIMLAGRAVTGVMRHLYPEGSVPKDSKGTVLVAALEGDVHDLGKNILKIVLTAKGYFVIDCGKDCTIQKIVDVAAKEFPMAVGISGLITSIIPLVKRVRGTLQDKGIDQVKVMAGGAALKQSLAEQLNVDYVADTVFDGAGYLDRIRNSAGGQRQ